MTGVRPVWADVDLAAIRHNASVLAQLVAPATLCAVVKANAYGHGPVPVSEAALAGGAGWLAVALVEEGAALRDAGIDAPVLLLSEPPPAAMGEVVSLGLTPTVYTSEGLAALAAAAATDSARAQPVGVHVKVDTGMHRVGASHDDAVKLALAVEEHPHLRLEGVWTHFAAADAAGDAVADADGGAFTAEQDRRLRVVLDELATAGIRPPLVHAANSAGALAHPGCHHDLVRCGIAVYGVAPSRAMEGGDGIADLRPALSLRAHVSFVKEVDPGEGVSYGLRYRPQERTVIATVPIGYADGVPWRLGVTGGEVLVRGRRRPIAGAVTMDQILVDCGGDRTVHAGDEVVLLGTQGDERVGAWEWAERVGTIAYEILCGIGPRVPRVYAGGAGGVKQPAALPR